MNKEMKKLLLNAGEVLEEIMKRLEYDRQLYENFSDDAAEEEKISKRIMILNKNNVPMYVIGTKYSDSTLKSMTKDALIELLKIAQHNYECENE